MSNRSRLPAQVSPPERLRILLVDADQISLDIYATSLRLADFTPFTATEPDAALALARAQRPHAIVCDVRLRRCFDGLELMERFHVDPQLSAVPLLVLTGFVRPTYQDLARGAGCVAWLVKPCEPDQLVAEIHLALDAVRTRASAGVRRVWSGLPLSPRPRV
jgi:CheY-like chemotaxis protein